MSLSDFKDDLYFRVQQYLNNGGFAPWDVNDYSHFELYCNEHGVVNIQKWDYDIKRPQHSDLVNIDNSEILDANNENIEKSKIISVAVLSDKTLLSMVSNEATHGMLCFAKDRNQLAIFLKPSASAGEWNLLKPVQNAPPTINWDSKSN
jgi:hypothetical protein